ncbi:MAG TPA: hypothetical protein VK825_14700 [Xanthobacteraceae bacterium]|jgi:hypothetical protein|nr:hypothetical protein [Xanthobacteraceae bacterium]
MTEIDCQASDKASDKASDEQILTYEISDTALEAAASTLPGAAMSMPNAPTVSILIACCGND